MTEDKHNNLKRIDFASVGELLAWRKERDKLDIYLLFAVCFGVPFEATVKTWGEDDDPRFLVQIETKFCLYDRNLAQDDIEQLFVIVNNPEREYFGGYYSNGDQYGYLDKKTGTVQHISRK